MDQVQQETHVAQQSRRNKLRILGSDHPLSSQSQTNSEHLQRATSSYPECSAEYLKGYPEHSGQNNIKNVFHGYNNYMIASEPYNILSAPESQCLPVKDARHFHAESAQQTLSLVANISTGESSIPVTLNSQVNASKTASWGSGGPQLGIMNNNALLNLPVSLNIMTSVAAAEMLAAPSIQSASFGSNGREESMATYFSGSSIQGDTMQTLYLMNPAVSGYPDSMASGSMVMINNTSGSVLATHNFGGNGQPQQQFFGISIPTASPSQRSSLGTLENSTAEHQSVTSSILTSGFGAHAYNSWQGGVNELTFLQTTDAASSNQSLCGQLNSSVKVNNPSLGDVSQLGMRHPSLSSIEGQQSEIVTRGVRLQLDQPQTGTCQSQELSLRLSPRHPTTVQLPSFQNHHTELDINCPGVAQATSEENTYGVDGANRDGMIGSGFSNSIHSPVTSKGIHSNSTGIAEFPNVLRGSKYLKAAQDLLDEVANLGNFGKHESAKHHKSPALMGAGADKENAAIEGGGKDVVADARTGHTTSAEEASNTHNLELTSAERQELQIKKAKLVAMLDEVNRKYRQYYYQMQIVVSSFEAVTEVGAAKTYTSLALQTISKHFRCLRDAITGQIHVASKGLGEDEMTGSRKGETSRLRFMDQQLRQQRALQHIGMIQQHAWRPQRGLPERAVSVLRAWLFEHFLHPYPKDADKIMLAKQAGLTRSQVSNWFINARVRLWKPMIEEMYMEEMKEAELGHALADKHGKNNDENNEDAKSGGGPRNCQNGLEEQKHTKARRLESIVEDEACEEQNNTSGSLKSEQSSESKYEKNQTFSMEEASDEEVFREVQDEAATQGELKKARNGIEEHTYHFSPHMSTLVGFKMEESRPENMGDNKFNDGRNNNENYSLVQNGMVLAGDNGGSASYQLGCLNRFEQESFLSRLSGIGDVSLTLGLQQSECLSLSGTQQSCISSQGRTNELGRASDGNCNINETASAHAANAYDSISLQNRKRFSTHIMQTL